MFKPIIIAIFIAVCAFVGSANDHRDSEHATHYPELIGGEMPLYPPVARTANISGTVEIVVTVERGSVIDVQVKSSASPLLTNPTVKNVKTWQFASEEPATFLVRFVYEIKGKQTLKPESPRLELDLPRLVKITVRPFRPTQT